MDAAQTWPGIVLILYLLRQVLPKVRYSSHNAVRGALSRALNPHISQRVLQNLFPALSSPPASALILKENFELKSQLKDEQLSHAKDIQSLEELMQGYLQLKEMLADAKERVAEEEAKSQILLQVTAAALSPTSFTFPFH
jgi:hypothetical protein